LIRTLPRALPSRIRLLLADDSEVKGLCSVSLLETAILHRLGRLRFEGTLTDLFAVGLARDVRVLGLTPVIAARTNQLPADFDGDPFDRAIVATASALNLTLLTAGPAIRSARACAVEYYPFRPARSRRT
jgi:PIN domain nuclease of toxin-antitoxin system